ncbi:MAG: VWA domain-containing protein [Blastocatellia bacterium]
MKNQTRIQSAIGCFFLLSLLSLGIFAQTEKKPDEQSQEKPLARIETIEAKIPVRAFDALGKRVLDLKPKEVIVIENGAGRQVTSLKLEPANILLVLDHSLEMGTYKHGRVRPPDPDAPSLPPVPPSGVGPNRWIAAPASVEFAETLIARLGETDHVAIIQYSDKVELIQNWTANGKEARAALRARFRQGHKTRFYDALRMAAETFKTGPAGRPVLVLLTDGVDTASQTPKDEAITALARSGVTIYAVNWSDAVKNEITRTKPRIVSGQGGTPRDTASASVSINIAPWIFKRNKGLKEYTKKAASNAAGLAQLAENSGGEGHLLKSFDELLGKPEQILEEIGAQYTLTYLTERRANETTARDLEVIGARTGLSVRARKKYYVGKDRAE